MKKVIVCICASLLLSSCARIFIPRNDFDAYQTPAAPDYSRDESWCALPWKKDSADVVPSNSSLNDSQDSAQVDVFYIHPTTYYNRKSWNASLDDKVANKIRDTYPVRMQASVFNGSCKIYAPAYRQATLGVFFEGEKSSNYQKAMHLAFTDVCNAFEYYMAHYNKGRPFIIASHSQGTWHAIELLKKYIDGKELEKQFIAGYLIGGNVKKNSFTHLKIMNSASKTGGVVCWRTMKDKRYVRNMNAKSENNIANVNPISWTTDNDWHGPENNPGSVPSTFDRIDRNLVSAQVSGDFLYVKKVHAKGYRARLGANYHLFDYGLFYMNIRMNVKDRIEAWFKKKG
jgi:hypothetical protein